MELLSPAGNFEKLKFAYSYGADAVYIGLKNFSLRAKADNFFEDEYKQISLLKEKYKKLGIEKKLYCALNISFHNEDITSLLENIEYFTSYPIDAFIIQDLGLVKIISSYFPKAKLHLSTQANCINSEACKVYRDLGFSRVVLGREASLKDIEKIKNDVKDLELECFVHGAMCIAYSGRCLISAYLTSRSANKGLCTHSCRWNYKLYKKESEQNEWLCEEEERKGEYFPIEEGEGYTSIFSSKDLCMIDYLKEMKDAGVDSIKIEGRMKSLYYTALVTRAYRKKLDLIEGKIKEEDAIPFIEELYNTSHRKFGTGFYFSPNDANETVKGETTSPYKMIGTIGEKLSSNEYEFIPKNKLSLGTPIEYVAPNIASIKDDCYKLLDYTTKEEISWTAQGHKTIIKTDKQLQEDFIVRALDDVSVK
ncbi:MAG: peptidase U32 family protein [Treponema sp.]